MKRVSYLYQLLVGIILLLAGFYFWWRISFFRGLPYVLLFLLIYFPARSLFLKWMSKTMVVSLIILLSIVIFLQLIFPCRFCLAKKRHKNCAYKLNTLYESKLGEWDIPFEEVMLDVGKGYIKVLQVGDESAEACILVSPFHLGNWSWIYNAPSLSRNYCLYVIEPVIYKEEGLQVRGSYPNSPEKIEKFMSMVLDELGLESVILTGVYDGANISCEYALQNPERVQKIVMISPFNDNYWRSIKSNYLVSGMFPLKVIVYDAFHNIYGDKWNVETQCRDWFYIKQRCMYPGRVKLSGIEENRILELKTPYIIISGNNSEDNDLINYKLLKNNEEILHFIDGKVMLNIEKSGEVNRLIEDFLNAGGKIRD